MYLIRGQNNIDLYRERFPEVSLCATIGNFDGLHLGHKTILKSIKNQALERGAKTIVFLPNHMHLNILQKKIIH